MAECSAIWLRKQSNIRYSADDRIIFVASLSIACICVPNKLILHHFKSYSHIHDKNPIKYAPPQIRTLARTTCVRISEVTLHSQRNPKTGSPSFSSTPSVMASTSLCWQYVPLNSSPRIWNVTRPLPISMMCTRQFR